MAVRYEIDFSRAALLVHDMQNALLHDVGAFAPESRNIIQNIGRLLALFREARLPVIYSKVIMRPDFVDWGLVAKIFPRDFLRYLTEGSEGAEIHSELAPKSGDIVIRKSAYSPFYSTNLADILRNLTVESLVITGVATNVGCDSTARDAFYRGFKVIFVTDATGTEGLADTKWGPMLPEQVHRATCANLGSYFAELSTTEELVTRLRAGLRADN